MSRVRVVQLIPNLGMGGAERMAVHLMQSLDRERFDVTAVSLYDSLGSDLEAMLADSRIPLLHLGKRPGFDDRTVSRITAALRRLKPHVVHSHLRVLRYALPGYLLNRVPAKVHTVHNIAQKEATATGRIVQFLAFRLGVVPVSIADEVTRTVADVYRIAPPTLIPNGIPVARYALGCEAGRQWRQAEGFDTDEVLLVCVANLTAGKNHRLLLRAFEQVLATSAVRAKLLLVGDGGLRAELETVAAPLGDAVRFLGQRTDVPEVLSAADAFVLASDYEGNPLSVMEAMAAGLPVVATGVGGVPELVTHDRNGIIVRPGEPAELAQALNRLVENPALVTMFGSAAAAEARERFSVEAMTRAYEELYLSLLGHHTPGLLGEHGV